MTFLLVVLSKGNLQSGKCRIWSQIWYDIVTLLIEKLTEQFIGDLCVHSYDVSSKVRVREPSLTFNGWVKSTEEATNPDFNIAQTRTTTCCVLAPSKGTGGELVAELMNHVERIIREVQSMDFPKSNMITSKREIQLETPRRKNIRLLRPDGKKSVWNASTVKSSERFTCHVVRGNLIRARLVRHACCFHHMQLSMLIVFLKWQHTWHILEWNCLVTGHVAFLERHDVPIYFIHTIASHELHLDV